MSTPALVCFAVAQEAKAFRSLALSSRVRVVITGMGSRNAEKAIGAAIDESEPSQVFTCGFAGALDPALRIGDVLFDTPDAVLAERLVSCGARPGKFHCAERVAITAAEKAALWRRTSASAVEMESAVIQRVCERIGVPCTTVRSISDIAGEDLPLDFNRLLTADQRLSPLKLGVAIVTAPQKLPALMRLGKNSAVAATRLAAVLDQVLGRAA